MGTTNTMMENSVDEIPVPFMSVEQTTKSSMTSSNSMTVMNIRKSPTLGMLPKISTYNILSFWNYYIFYFSSSMHMGFFQM